MISDLLGKRNPNPLVHEVISIEGTVNYADLSNYNKALLNPKRTVKRMGDSIHVYSRKVPGMRLATWRLQSDGQFYLVSPDLTGHDNTP